MSRFLILSAALVLVLWPASLLAQVLTSSTATVAGVATATVAVTLDELLTQGQGVADAFRMLGALAGITAIVNLLINMTKYGMINDFIVRKKVKWIRPVLALIAGLLGGFAAATAKGLPLPTAALYSVGGLLAGGGSIALHELWTMTKGRA